MEKMTTKFRIQDFMTASPVSISPDLSILDARERMFENGIRHLPVMSSKERLLGVISQRDVAVLEASFPKQSNTINVETAMSNRVYTCLPDARIDAVSATMVSEKYGCAIVVDEERNVLGIFTTVDALRALVYFSEPFLKDPANVA